MYLSVRLSDSPPWCVGVGDGEMESDGERRREKEVDGERMREMERERERWTEMEGDGGRWREMAAGLAEGEPTVFL